MRKLVLFDIDGTLLLTAGAGRRAITAALAECVGSAEAFDRVRFDGKTDPQIVVELLEAAGAADLGDGARVDALCARYLELLEIELAKGASDVRLMPGVVPLLERLERESGVVIGLLTGNLERGAVLKLRAAGLEPARFRVGAYGSDSPNRPELPPIATRRALPLFGREPSGADVVIIGDTPADIRCGDGIGARALAVATGFYTRDELEPHVPYALFDDLGSTDEVLAAILE